MGNKSAAGKPPAKEMMSGWPVTLSISRTAERFIRLVRRAKHEFQFILYSLSAAARAMTKSGDWAESIQAATHSMMARPRIHQYLEVPAAMPLGYGG